MKFRMVHNSARLFRRLDATIPLVREAAVDAAAEALKQELRRSGGSAISVQPHGARRSVGSDDPADAAREYGTLEHAPSPWLAPALPTALEPMRTAARTAAVRAVSALKRKK